MFKVEMIPEMTEPREIDFQGIREIYDQKGELKCFMLNLGMYEPVFIHYNKNNPSRNFQIMRLAKQLGISGTFTVDDLNEYIGNTVKLNKVTINISNGREYRNVDFAY